MIVNAGNGANFQTGLDVVQLSRDPEALREQSRRTKRAELRISAWHNDVATPVIAAVNGACAGGGLHFVADADIVIAAADATFLDPHVSVGQVTAYEAIALARKAPFEAIMRMALVGRHERVSAERAYQLGVVSEVVDPPERLHDRAQELAETIARNSPYGHGRQQAGIVAGPRARASPTPAGPAPGPGVACGATPTRPRAPPPSPRNATPALAERRAAASATCTPAKAAHTPAAPTAAAVTTAVLVERSRVGTVVVMAALRGRVLGTG